MYSLERHLFNQLSGLNSLINGLPGGTTFAAPEGRSRRDEFPRLNIWKNDNAVVLTAEVPGVDPADIDLNITSDKIGISGELPSRNRAEGEAYQRLERSSGKFQRQVDLPFRIDTEKVSAECRNGVLKVRLQRAEADKPRKIAVKAA